MASPSSKQSVRRVRRRVSSANSPTPEGVSMGAALCGHSGCGDACNVRYAGATTHLRDHYAVHAARGVAHVWPAAIVAGLAIVLSGAFAYAAVPEKSAAATEVGTVAAELRMLNAKVDRMEKLVDMATASVDASTSNSY